MYKVNFSDLLVFEADKLEAATGFGFSLHQSSNVPHKIEVYKEDNVFCTFIRKND